MNPLKSRTYRVLRLVGWFGARRGLGLNVVNLVNEAQLRGRYGLGERGRRDQTRRTK